MTDGLPWLTIVGIGEDGLDGLAPVARSALAEAEWVVGGRRHLELAAPAMTGRAIAWRSPLEDTIPEILSRRGQPTCVLATGDPFHFGIGATLTRSVAAGEMRCFPHASAFSLAAARLGWALQACTCLSLHGRALGRIVAALQPGARILALSWDGGTPAALAALLRERGFGPSRLHVCEALGGARERLRTTTAATFDFPDVIDLNTVAIEVAAEPGARIPFFAPGMPDDWFEHDGQITKAPIRALTLSALAPRAGERLWDIGSGSGSVGIEWLLSHETLSVSAVERNAARAVRARRNADHWGVADRFDLTEAAASDVLARLPRPDAVFIGGGVTEPGLLDCCRAALRPGGRLVVNAVTIESQQVLAAALAVHGGELLQVAVARAEPVGRFHGFRPAMPVTQWRFVTPFPGSSE